VARRMPSMVDWPVTVVEEVLGHGVVDRNDGIAKHAVGRHGLQADNAGGGLLGAADDLGHQVLLLGVQNADHVGAVIHGNLGAFANGLVDMFVIGLVVFALDGESRHLEELHACGRNVVLGAQGVRGAEPHISTARLQCGHQVGGFGCYVQACADGHAFEGFFLRETLLDAFEHRHVHGRPLNAVEPFLRQSHILYVIICH
jgi:hypothetical protein